MKSTGVIRRIDELGRVVIPKEIRRNLGIRDGENVEIYTESDSIILKKYNRLTSTNELASNLCEIINNELNYKIMITDREKVIAQKGFNEDLVNKLLSNDYLEIIDNREIVEQDSISIEGLNIESKVILVPIISLNDSIGLVIISSNETYKETNIGKLIASIFANKLDI